jgi:tetratricopeptide (TPR) repeat protein
MLNKIFFKNLFIYATIIILLDCAYYNTFFNAIKNYKSAVKALEKSKTKEVTSNINNDFQKAIDKCWKLINEYGDSSKYADDALLLIAKSYYYMNDYIKAERYLSQFNLRYLASELLPEAKLWLARTYIKLGKDEEAQNQFTDILSNPEWTNRGKVKHEIAAYALLSLGEFYYEREKYDLALENFRKCLEVSKEDQISAQALFAAGNIYFMKGEYINAIENYKKIQHYEVTDLMNFEVYIKRIESQIYLKQFGKTIKELKEMLRQNRFGEHFSVIESKIGECYQLENNLTYAAQHYSYVIEKYPKTEGSAIAVYQLAKMMEFYYADIDSAQKLYARAVSEYPLFQDKDKAARRAKILDEYLKIRINLDRDIVDMNKINELDFNPDDSVRTIESVYYTTTTEMIEEEETDIFAEPDSVKLNNFGLDQFTLKDLVLPDQFNIKELNLPKNFELDEDFKDIYELSLQEILKRAKYDTTLVNTFLQIAPDTTALDTILTDLIIALTPKTRKITQKHVQIRTEDEVRNSLEKNKFGLAEFFLLTMQNFDSALTAYSNFIKASSQHSELIPKAYHALYYIYSYKLLDSLRADSMEQIICKKYPDSEYANYIYKKQNKHALEKKDDTYKNLFFKAESLFYGKIFYRAIDIYTHIAENDSGSNWAEKSRYAVAWIYEKELNDLPRAIEAYTIITREYPNKKIYDIALNKIKKPDMITDTTLHAKGDSLSMQEIVTDSLINQQNSIEETINSEPENTLPDSVNQDKNIFR